jgi:nucleoid-associated protein YgaU
VDEGAKKAMEARARAMEARKKAMEKEAKKVKAEHTVAEGETLSDLALKYYGSAAKEKWMAIYEANKGVIGDDPNLIKPGQELKIPEL